MSIKASGLAFRHADGTVLFSEIHFSLHEQKVGLVGRNGSGKTTLLRLIAGEIAPSGGALRVAIECAFFAQLPAQGASGGERARERLVELWRAAPGCLLLDEPTNSLDESAREELKERLRRWRGPALIASHDVELLREVDEIWELHDGGLRVYGGNYDDYLEQRAVERAAAERELANAESELQRTRRNAQLAKQRQEKRIATAKRRAPDAGIPRILLGLRKRRGQLTLARVQGVHEKRERAALNRKYLAREAVADDERPRWDPPAVAIPASRMVASWRDSQCRLLGPSRVALLGANGSGKTTRLRALFERQPEAEVRAARIAYLDQDLLSLDEEKSLLENLREKAPGIDERDLRIALGRALFAQKRSSQKVRELSGGERLRATLAAILAGTPAPELLLLDEPTNHLDRESVDELRRFVLAFPGALIVVSHDRAFLESIEWDEVWEMHESVPRPARL